MTGGAGANAVDSGDFAYDRYIQSVVQIRGADRFWMCAMRRVLRLRPAARLVRLGMQGAPVRSGSKAGRMCRRMCEESASMHANRGRLLPGSKCMSVGA